jgi:hypothetical protein
MSIVVNDPKELPISIFQVPLSKVPFVSIEFLDSITKQTQKKEGIKNNNYYLLPTQSKVSWLQPSKELANYHMLLKLVRTKRHCAYLMIINDKTNV